MSTTIATYKSANEIFPHDELEVYRGSRGIVLYIKSDGGETGLKFWLSDEDAKSLSALLREVC